MTATRQLTFVCMLSLLAALAPLRVTEAQQERENVRISGVVADLGPGLLQVTDKAGVSWLVKIEPEKTEVNFVGTALLDWVRPGMWIQIRTSLNQRLQADGPVNEMTVFTPKPEVELGIVREFSFGQNSLGGEGAASKGGDAKAEKEKPVACVVRGRFVGIKKNKMTISAGQLVTFEVPEEVKVLVEVSDYSLAKPGDKVEITGWKYENLAGRAIATEVAIAAEQPLTIPKPTPRSRRASSSSDAKARSKEPSGDAKGDAKDSDKKDSDKKDSDKKDSDKKDSDKK